MASASKAYEFSPEVTPEQVCAEIERNYSTNNPNVGKTQSTFLKKGPQTYKFALLQEILDRETQEHHHNVLTLKSYKRLKGGWVNQDERVFALDDETVDEIDLLEVFIKNFRSYDDKERKTYDVVESSDFEKMVAITQSGVGETIRELLEDGDNYKLIVEQGGLELTKQVVEWMFKQENTESLMQQLKSLNLETLVELQTVAGLSQIEKILGIWAENRNNDNEEFWQKTLVEYSWLISQIFAGPIILYKEKAYVGGKTLDNKGGNLVDLIYKSNLSANVILVELKTPCTQILGEKYRQTYSMSSELSGAINQTLNYKYELQQNYIALQMANRKDRFEAINPRTLLVIGNFSLQLDDTSKVEAFEMYRQNLKDVVILSYDELFAKVEILKSILLNGK